MRPTLWIPFAVTFLALASPASADVKLPAVFGDQMVLQAGKPVPIWGTADPGETVTVAFAGQSVSARATAGGKWLVALQPLSVPEARAERFAGRPLTVTGQNTIELSDVLVGEVWVASGQSNMEWSLKAAKDPELEIAAANHPGIRLFSVPRKASPEPLDDVAASWTACTPESARDFSAVAYYFGRQLRHTLDQPIGLIKTSWGGTRAEAWTSPRALANDDFLQPLMQHWDELITDYPNEVDRHTVRVAEWVKESAAAEAAGKQLPRKPRLRADPTTDRHRPSNLYRGMIAPLAPLAIRGAIWYQGEANASRAWQYRELFPLMIRSWRQAFGQGDFPFYFVQLANFRDVVSEPADADWAELREAQTLTLSEPNTGMACIIDIGMAKDIHPKNKQDVGKRLARLALVNDYGFDGKLALSGPRFRAMNVNGNEAVLEFDELGYPRQSLMSWDRQPLRGFAIAGEDRKFVWANARIDKNRVIVSHPDVPNPVAVRYNWANNPVGNLYNSNEQPAWPFRTDDWPMITEGRHH